MAYIFIYKWKWSFILEFGLKDMQFLLQVLYERLPGNNSKLMIGL